MRLLETLLWAGFHLLEVYCLLGGLFAVPFVWKGVHRLDPHAQSGTWGFRCLLIPGTILLWPMLAKRWIQGSMLPPAERSAHRLAAQREQQGRI